MGNQAAAQSLDSQKDRYFVARLEQHRTQQKLAPYCREKIYELSLKEGYGTVRYGTVRYDVHKAGIAVGTRAIGNKIQSERG